jgi:hypothetical protein
MCFSRFLSCVILFFSYQVTYSFSPQGRLFVRHGEKARSLPSRNDDEDVDDGTFKSDFEIFSKITDKSNDTQLKQRGIMDELEWRSAKITLEEANERAFLKRIRSKPWKLPYEDAVS